MKVALCNGGLGNQVFQYIFARWMELSTGEVCYLDDSAFFGKGVMHNGFEIPKVFPNAKPNLLSKALDEDVWKFMLRRKAEGVSICQQLNDAGHNFTMVAETLNYQFNGNIVHIVANEYAPALYLSSGNIYFHGYWINREWFKGKYYDILRKELMFIPLTEPHNLAYAQQMEDTFSISVHIRRGDFVDLHWETPPEVYKQIIEMVEQKCDGVQYFVFSDDLAWCQSHMEELGLEPVKDRITFVTGNTGVNNFRDMQLMTMCKGNILADSSSFGYLAALLNVNENPIIINATARKV